MHARHPADAASQADVTMTRPGLIWIAAIVSAVALTSCSTLAGYDKAFSQTTALSGNVRSFNAPPEQLFRIVKVTLVQRGFTIEQADAQSGLIRCSRSLQDAKDAKLAYLVSSTVDISAAPAGDSAMLSMSASQQTVLHRDSTKYYKFLGLVPIPTGKDYQTVVRREGTIGSKQFYDDFFNAVGENLKLAPAVAVPLPAVRLAVASATGEATPPSVTITPAAPPEAKSTAAIRSVAAGQSPATPDAVSPQN